MITKTASLIAAEHVLNLVLNDPNTKEVEGWVECYQNGREQGFLVAQHITIDEPHIKTIYFANHRNSDQIVVYCGKYSCQGLSDDAWQNAFYSKSHEEAAEYIISKLKE